MEKIIYRERKNTDCIKWDVLQEKFGQDDLIALWVADMDFQVPACVMQSLRDYVETGAYGYYKVPARYHEAFINWEKAYHGYEVQKEWIRFAPGVVPAINWLVQVMTEPGDGIGVMTPVYYPFMNAVNDHGRKLVNCPLKKVTAGELADAAAAGSRYDGLSEGTYTMDLDQFEQLAAAGEMKLFILCSPHNPVGRVWTRQELEGLLTICEKYGIFVLADEIHQDIITGDREQIAAATVAPNREHLVTMTAATKTFNLAGVQNSFVIIPSEEVRKRWDALTEPMHISNGNAFGYVAVASAYAGGREWLDGVLEIIRGNFEYMRDTLKEQLPQVKVHPLEGTYLSWVDLGAYVKPEEMEEIVQRKAGLAVDYGDWFGGEKYGAEYATFIRVNLATRRENVEQAVKQLVEAIRRQS